MGSPQQMEASCPETVESALRDEFGLPPRRVGSAQGRATSDSPVQSAASIDLAWRVVFAAEQRKAQIMEHARPLAFRSRRLEKGAEAHTSPDRPGAAHGRPVGELQVAPIPARQLLRSGRAGAGPAAVEGEPQDREDLDSAARLSQEIRCGAAQPSSGGKEGGSSGSRRRRDRGDAQQLPGTAAADCGIAVSGQSLSRNRPPTGHGPGWPPDAPPDATSSLLLEVARQRVTVAAAAAAAGGSGATEELSEATRQAEMYWQLQCAAGPMSEEQALQQVGLGPRQLPHDHALNSGWAVGAEEILAGGDNWSGRLLITPENEDPCSAPFKTAEDAVVDAVERWSAASATNGDVVERSVLSGQERELRHAPASAGEAHSEEYARVRRVLAPATAGERAEKTSAAAASASASARTTRRASIASAHRVASTSVAASSSGVPSSAQEPLSPTRPGASIRRSRSMPASRKSTEETCAKPKAARSSFARRSDAPGSRSSMPKSTAAAAAGAGAVAAKKRAKASRKLMLPFAYAEDDPRVHHVECADGRVVPEYLP